MWLEAWVKEGKRIEVYKHYDTRICIHLDERGKLVSSRRLNEWLKKLGDLPVLEVGRRQRFENS
ncbi:MAG: hypothetical protein ABR505_04595 [Actinomycetota bacterium]